MNYRKQKMESSKIKGVKAYQAEPLEGEIRRIMNNDGKIDGAIDAKAPIIHTERKDGVLAHYNIRTDKWEVMADAMDKSAELHAMQREVRNGERTYDTMTPEQQQDFNKKFPENAHAKQQKSDKPSL